MIHPLPFQMLDAPDALPLEGLALVLAERLRQIEQFGHTPEADADHPPADIFAALRRYHMRVRDDLDCRAPRETTLRHATIAAAMWLALVDRLLVDAPAQTATA